MIDEEQLVETRWVSATKNWYISCGYTFTKIFDPLFVKVKHLKPSSNVIVKVTCDYCNKEYYCIYNDLNRGKKNNSKDACKECKNIKGTSVFSPRLKDKTWEKLNNYADERNFTILSQKEEYQDYNSKIKYICPKHGIRTSTVASLISSKCACRKCGMERLSLKVRLPSIEVKEIIESKNSNLLLNPEEYVNAHEKNLKIKCGDCGEVYITSLLAYNNGCSRCPDCAQKESSGERKVRKYLESQNYIYEKEKRFKDCKDINTLPFDFYVPQFNLIIEFDGIQHFKENKNWGPLEYVQKHDAIKNEYCKNKHIHLLRIPYTQINYVEEIISQKIKEITIE